MTILSIFQPWRSAGVSPLRGRNWRPVTSLASQGSLSQVLKCHHVACNGPVVRSPVSCGTCFYISVVPRSHRRTEVLAILCPQQSETTCRPSTKMACQHFQWSNSKNKWICWFLGPERAKHEVSGWRSHTEKMPLTLDPPVRCEGLEDHQEQTRLLSSGALRLGMWQGLHHDQMISGSVGWCFDAFRHETSEGFQQAAHS